MTAALALAALLLAGAAALAAGRPPAVSRLPGRGVAAPPRRRDRPQRAAQAVAAGQTPPERARTQAAVAAGAALVVVVLVPGAVGAIGAGAAAVLAWRWAARLEPASVRRRREIVVDELPHVVDLLLATVAVGASPAEALARVAEVVHPAVADELAVAVGRLGLGGDPVAVWRELADHPELGRLGRTLRRSAESGAPVVEALERLADDLRALRRTEVENRVRQVEVRAAVPLGVCLLPAFVLVGVVPLVAGAASSLLVTVR